MKRTSVGLLLGLLVATSGCAHVSTRDFTMLRKGMTKNQVRELLGAPGRVEICDGAQRIGSAAPLAIEAMRDMTSEERAAFAAVLREITETWYYWSLSHSEASVEFNDDVVNSWTLR